MNCIVRPVVFLVLVAGSSTLAFAKSRPTQLSADECGKAAKKACIKGDVGKGIDILGDLYVETGDITFVFNQGRCFQQNHRWEEALDRFNEFLRKARNLSQNEKDEVDRYIADCQSHLPAAQPPAVAASPSSGVPVLSPMAQGPGAAASADALAARSAGNPAVTSAAGPQPGSDPRGQSPAGLALAREPDASADQAASRPLYKKPVFWVIVGAVVAGGVATALIATRGAQYPSGPSRTLP